MINGFSLALIAYFTFNKIPEPLNGRVLADLEYTF